jgi:hypothetical protein
MYYYSKTIAKGVQTKIRSKTASWDIQDISALAKGQLNSEWIYEVIVSPKIATKNFKDFCPGSLLLQG